MPRQIITTANAPLRRSTARESRPDRTCWSEASSASTQAWALAGGTIQDQARQALANREAILQAGGASLDDVIEVGILLTNPADFTASTRNTRGGRRSGLDPLRRQARR